MSGDTQPNSPCDFCGNTHSHRVYSADGHEGGWSACKQCEEMIDAGRWIDLTERALSASVLRHPARYDRSRLRAMIEDMHTTFRQFMRTNA